MTFIHDERENLMIKQWENCMISKANMLAERFLTHPDQMKWVRAILAFIVDLCLRLLNWHGWMKLFDIIRNCSLPLIIFSKSFSVVFNRMMG